MPSELPPRSDVTKTEQSPADATVGAREARVPQHTDAANARRFIRYCGGDVRYIPARKKWLVWGDHRWQIDELGVVMDRAKEVHRLLAREAMDTTAHAWAKASGSRDRILAMLALAQSEPEVAVSVTQLDANPLLLGVQNGVVDLATGRRIPTDRAQLITMQAGTVYDEGATCPRWKQFIDEVTGRDADLATYLQRFAGYCLTGLTSDQSFFVLWGGGANGKSVFLRTLQSVLGDYSRNIVYQALMVTGNSQGPTPYLARLPGARLAVAAEPSADSCLDEATIKLVTGQDRIACRAMYGDAFEFDPQFKLVLATNHKPEIKGTDEGIWRRQRLIPFDQTFPPERRDMRLQETLARELPGILNWMIEGALAFQQAGLQPPSKVTAAILSYRTEMDTFAQWLDEACEQSRAAVTPIGALYDAYSAWCHNGRMPLVSKRKFGDQLSRRGFELCSLTGNTRARQGLRLRRTKELR